MFLCVTLAANSSYNSPQEKSGLVQREGGGVSEVQTSNETPFLDLFWVGLGLFTTRLSLKRIK